MLLDFGGMARASARLAGAFMTSQQPHPFPPPWADAWGYDDASPYPFVAIELAPDVAMRLRWVPPGRFQMGSPASEMGRTDYEGPQHWVELSSGLWLAETPCTQAEWEAVMGNNPSRFTGDGQRPVEQVSWEDCQEYCGKLNALCPDLGARLPTEAEWEYACRAGTATAYNDGSACTEPEGDDPALEKLGWFNRNSGSSTHPVREKLANAWGIYDLHGNVYEWCSDYWSDNYRAETQQDPLGPTEGRDRVYRGGGWYLQALYCRSASRSGREPGFRWYWLCFRLAAGQSSEPSK
jgi:formylglycine-generating enzyme required for sulfatase activity